MTTDQPELSKCHKAPVSVRGSGEGTHYWVCGTCHRPCDLYTDQPYIDELDEVLANFQHRTGYYIPGTGHEYKWSLRTLKVGDEGLLCKCGFHVRREWLDEAKAKLHSMLIEAENRGGVRELERLKEDGKWFTERGYYCFNCNTLTHPDSYRNTSGRLGIPYICSNCGVGQVTHSSHVSLEQIKRRLIELTNKQEGEQ